MRICVLASGSKGNCTFVEGENTRILIDAGLTKNELETRLSVIGIDPNSIDSILVTHEHNDHIKGLGAFARAHNSKIYAHPDTWSAMEGKVGTLELNQRFGIYGKDFYINEIAVSSFDLSHDSKHCLGFSIYDGNKKISSATDLGYITDDIIKHLADSSLVILEANHDITRLMQNPHYPMQLKQRILSKQGHLNNQDTANSVLKMLGYGVRGIIAAHLSEENNSPELVLQALNETVAKNGGNLAKELHVDIAKQDQIGNIYRIKS